MALDSQMASVCQNRKAAAPFDGQFAMITWLQVTPPPNPTPTPWPSVRCHLSLQCFRCFLPSSPLDSFVSPAYLLEALELVTLVLRVLQNQLLLNSIWWWRQIFCIQTCSTASPWDAYTMLLGRIWANSFKECPLIKRKSNLTQVFLRGSTICLV